MKVDDHYRGLKEHMSGLRVHDHICHAYDDREQQVTAIASYLKPGLELGEKCLYVADKANTEFVLKVLKDTGIEVDELVANGALGVATPEQVYLRKGFFDPDDLISLGRTLVAESLARGFKALRTASDMTWARNGNVNSKALLDYESKISCLFDEKLVSICQYNTHCFDSQVIDGMLKSHPTAICGGAVMHNPQFAGTNSFPLMHEQTA